MRRTDIRSLATALTLAALALAAAALPACSTVRGAGEDIQYAADETAKAISGGKNEDAQ